MPVIVEDEGGASGISLDGLVSRVRRLLGDRDNINKLKTSISDTDSTVVLTYKPSNIYNGSLITINDETMHVWEVSGNTLIVERARRGTSATAHDANEITYTGGKPRQQIIDAINDELSSLSSQHLYQMKSVLVDGYNTSDWAYQVDDLNKATIYNVQYLVTGQDSDWRDLKGWSFNPIDNTMSFNTEPWFSYDVRVLYKAPLGRFTDGTDDLETTTGLRTEAADVVVYGAAYRLTIGDESIRNDFRSQGDTRRPGEVPPGAVLRASVNGFKAIRDERLGEEQQRLRNLYPYRRAGW